MRVIVAIPTTSRPGIVVPTVRDIARQSRLPDMVVVAVAGAGDIDPAAVSDLPFPVCIIESERGATFQRNAALDMLHPDDCMLFLDDDFVMAPDFLANLEGIFAAHSDVAMVTGTVLADGIKGPGFAHDYALDLLSDQAGAPAEAGLRDVYNCYGCNMALRAKPLVKNRVRFDTRLKLYSWLEDVDFSRQMAEYGRIVKAAELRGVHLGTKTGRSSGLRLGYSQIANPLYLNAKGTMIWRRAFHMMFRNVSSNLVRSVYPEPEIDRIGRLKGNFRAFADLLRGRLKPENVVRFE
jgi:GT2 family glycosyltransferase